jgi:hypothetical protein
MLALALPVGARGGRAGHEAARASHPGWNGIIEGNEQITFPPLPRDRHPSAGDPMPALPPHRRLPARRHQRDPDRALPPDTSRSARSCAPVTAPRRNPRGCFRCQRPRIARCTGHAALKYFKVSFPWEYAHEHVQESGTWSEVMTSAGTPLRRSARPGWYGSGWPTRARADPSVLASWTVPSASASHSRGLASDDDWAGTCRLKRTRAPGILSLARLFTSFRISADRDGSRSRGPWSVVPDAWSSRFSSLTIRSLQHLRLMIIMASPAAGRPVR